jgi:hypothetical protein
MDKTRHITSAFTREILKIGNGRKPDPGGMIMPIAPVACSVFSPVFKRVFPTQCRLS